MYNDNAYTISISLNKKLDYSAPIFFVPYAVPLSHKASEELRKTSRSPQITPVVQKKTALAKPAATKTAITPKSPELKKTPVIVTPAKQVTPPVLAAATPIKPDVKKAAATAQPQTKTPEPTKIAAVKPATIESLSPTKKEDPKVVEPKTHETKPTNNITHAVDTQHEIVPMIPDNAIVSNNYREVEAMRRGAQLQKELVQKWKPPCGVSPECLCEISFSVNKSGALHDLKMIKSSHVAMYDISARQALYTMKMPQWTHGKNLIIIFKQ